MKIIFRLSLMAVLVFLYSSCGEKLDPTPSLTIDIETGAFDPNGPSIEGIILSKGDGILRYGHMWTEAPHQGTDCPEIVASKSSLYTADINTNEPFFTDLSAFATGTYFIRSYLVDVHNVTYCSEEVAITIGGDFSVDFDINNNNCKASCAVEFINTSSINATSFQWFINDSLVAETRDYTHQFDVPGAYEVRLEGTDGLITKSFTDNATVEWLRYGKPITGYGSGIDILPHPNGGYVIAGNRSGDVYMIRVDQNGTVDPTFNVSFNHSNNDKANDLIFVPIENAFFVVGESSPPNSESGNTDIFIGKVSIEGAIINEDRFGITNLNAHNEEAFSVNITDDNNLIITGRYSHPSDDSTRLHSFWYTINTDFEQRFHSILYHPEDGNLVAEDILALDNGEFAFIGSSKQPLSSITVATFFKTDNNGTLLPNSIVSYGENFSEGYQMIQLFNNEIVLGGSRLVVDGDFLILNADENGNASEFTIDIGTTDATTNLFPISNSSFLLTGTTIAMEIPNGYLALIDYDSATPHVPVWDETYENIKLNATVPTPDGGYMAVGDLEDVELYIIKTDSIGQIND